MSSPAAARSSKLASDRDHHEPETKTVAELLFQIGRYAARRRLVVIGTWLVILALAAAAYAVGGGPLGSQITIPGTPTDQVAQRLATDFPAAAGGSRHGRVPYRGWERADRQSANGHQRPRRRCVRDRWRALGDRPVRGRGAAPGAATADRGRSNPARAGAGTGRPGAGTGRRRASPGRGSRAARPGQGTARRPAGADRPGPGPDRRPATADRRRQRPAPGVIGGPSHLRGRQHGAGPRPVHGQRAPDQPGDEGRRAGGVRIRRPSRVLRSTSPTRSSRGCRRSSASARRRGSWWPRSSC